MREVGKKFDIQKYFESKKSRRNDYIRETIFLNDRCIISSPGGNIKKVSSK